MICIPLQSGQSSSSAADTVSQQRKLQLEQFVKATKCLLMTYEKVYESKEVCDLAMKRMLGPQLEYFVNCMLTKFNFKNRFLSFLFLSHCSCHLLMKQYGCIVLASVLAI